MISSLQKADYRFTGQRWQNDIGLYYYNARWYDHLIGRFTQPDPLVPEGGPAVNGRAMG